MSLTTTQLSTLKSAILADNTLAPLLDGNADHEQAIADALNATASPDFFVWRTNVPVPDIYDQVTWANYTPNDAIPTDTALNNAIWQARAFDVQIKQSNLQMILGGRTLFDASKSTQRSGLQDATLNLPTGTAGANRSVGWANILLILSRKATRAEKLLASTTNGTGASQAIGATGPATLTFEGTLSQADIDLVHNS